MTGKKRKQVKTLLGIAAGLAVTAVCPPAGVAFGMACFLKGAKKYAKSGKIEDAQDMILNYGGSIGKKK